MLNYIWLTLLLIGILVAFSSDMKDVSTNRYHNGEVYEGILRLAGANASDLQPTRDFDCEVRLPNPPGTVQRARLIVGQQGAGALHIVVDEKTPDVWREIFRAQSGVRYLVAHVQLGRSDSNLVAASITFDPVRFVKMNTVTNDGIFKSARSAVELAIGLIGIMALWLGIMKIAEQSGLVAALARVLKPFTTRLFPDVPPDHPAMGAMIMNISANMLGLANAATPLGLKAMEELNKLNKKIGTATDAMCTFLVINTSSVQLIPATVIALRAAAGSANPTEIIGPVIVATTVNTIAGVIAVKLLARMRVFRRQIES